MKRFIQRVFILVLLGGTLAGSTGCKLFKKKCDCPHWSINLPVQSPSIPS